MRKWCDAGRTSLLDFDPGLIMRATAFSLLLAYCMMCLSCNAIRHTPGSAYPISVVDLEVEDWHFDGVAKWMHGQDAVTGDKMLIISENSAITDPVRRPGAVAVYDQHAFSDFVIETSLICKASPDNVRGDLVLVLGYVSPTQFHYLHLTGTVDSIHNGLFVVADADRVRLGQPIAQPLLTDRAPHDIRLEYNSVRRLLSLTMDGETRVIIPELSIPAGKIGVGSFNDPGAFRGIRIRGIPQTKD